MVRVRPVCGRAWWVPLSTCGRDEPEGSSSCRPQVGRGRVPTRQRAFGVTTGVREGIAAVPKSLERWKGGTKDHP